MNANCQINNTQKQQSTNDNNNTYRPNENQNRNSYIKWSSTNDLSVRIAHHHASPKFPIKFSVSFSIHSMPFARNECERRTCNYTVSRQCLFGHIEFRWFKWICVSLLRVKWTLLVRVMYDKRNEIENNCSGCVLRRSHFRFVRSKLKWQPAQCRLVVICFLLPVGCWYLMPQYVFDMDHVRTRLCWRFVLHLLFIVWFT